MLSYPSQTFSRDVHLQWHWSIGLRQQSSFPPIFPRVLSGLQISGPLLSILRDLRLCTVRHSIERYVFMRTEIASKVGWLAVLGMCGITCVLFALKSSCSIGCSQGILTFFQPDLRTDMWRLHILGLVGRTENFLQRQAQIRLRRWITLIKTSFTGPALSTRLTHLSVLLDALLHSGNYPSVWLAALTTSTCAPSLNKNFNSDHLLHARADFFPRRSWCVQ